MNSINVNMNPIVSLPRLKSAYWFRRRRQIDYFRTNYEAMLDLMPRRVFRNELHVVVRGRPTVVELSVRCRQSAQRNHRVVVNVFQKTVDERTGKRVAKLTARHVIVF